MIGRNYDDRKVFDQGDARELVDWANARGVGLLAFWEIQRDRYNGSDLLKGSGVPQEPYEFASIFAGFGSGSGPTPTPTPEPTPIPPADPQGDVTAYESGAPIEAPPPGLDIRAASAADDLKVVLQPIAGVPEALTGWAGENDVLLWISLYEPVPTSLAVYTDWLFVLDLDGDTTTGRPAGSARINPDLGTEAALGVSFNATAGQYEPYFWVWDPAQDDWTEVAGVSRFIIDDSRTIVGLAVPLETLTRSVAETTGVTVAPEAVKGRAAALTFVGDQAVIDFYPDRPQ